MEESFNFCVLSHRDIFLLLPSLLELSFKILAIRRIHANRKSFSFIFLLNTVFFNVTTRYFTMKSYKVVLSQHISTHPSHFLWFLSILCCIIINKYKCRQPLNRDLRKDSAVPVMVCFMIWVLVMRVCSLWENSLHYTCMVLYNFCMLQ